MPIMPIGTVVIEPSSRRGDDQLGGGIRVARRNEGRIQIRDQETSGADKQKEN